jgi:hypothetical protein
MLLPTVYPIVADHPDSRVKAVRRIGLASGRI